MSFTYALNNHPLNKRGHTVKRTSNRANPLKVFLHFWRNRQEKLLFFKRAIANGINSDQLRALVQESKGRKELFLALNHTAEKTHLLGKYWSEIGIKQRARDCYLEAALWRFYAHLILSEDDARKAPTYLACAQSYHLAAPHFVCKAIPVNIPYQFGFLKGYLRFPSSNSLASVNLAEGSTENTNKGDIDINHHFYFQGNMDHVRMAKKFPLVIIVNGINSAKEELYYTESAFLNEGLATLSFDYPGSGESCEQRLGTFNEDALAKSLYFFAASQQGIDIQRIALFGINFGGVLALNWAANQPKHYAALATLSCPYSNKSLNQRQINYMLHGSKDQLLEIVDKISVKDQLKFLACPILVALGAKDSLVRASDARLLYDDCLQSDKKLLFLTHGGHNCYEMMPSLRHEIAQWIKLRI